jgi:hypothetical protein
MVHDEKLVDTTIAYIDYKYAIRFTENGIWKLKTDTLCIGNTIYRYSFDSLKTEIWLQSFDSSFVPITLHKTNGSV